MNEQIDAMTYDYPNLRVLARHERSCIWRGCLRPYRKTVWVEIAYHVPRIPENVTIGGIQPRVQIRRPILERHPDYDEGPIPHVYFNKNEPLFPFLCLFDPDVPEWSTSDLIADTTVPWTERWLLNYEFWLATGQWRGGGRHVSQEVGDKSARLLVHSSMNPRGTA